MSRRFIRFAAALALAATLATPASAGPLVPGPAGRTDLFALVRIWAAQLRGVFDAQGMSIDPDGATVDKGMSIDPNGAAADSDRGMSIDPDG